ncbi:MAG: polyprenyl synthetase family protein [Brevinemataceae bacterium]
MTFLSFLDETKHIVSQEIKQICDILSKYSSPEATTASQRIKEFTLRGKMIRACIARLSALSFGSSKNSNEINKIAAIIELAQSALLIHDDIMDNDDLRRGKPSIHKIYENDLSCPKAEQAGKSLGYCIGDALLFFIFSQLAYSPKLTTLFSEELTHTAFGQAFDITLSTKTNLEIDQQDLFDLIKYKTAHYTFRLPLLAGAISSDSSLDLIPKLDRFAVLAGYIFQIRDDELNLISSQEMDKTFGGDVKENKKNLCMFYLLESNSQVKNLLTDPQTDIRKIQELYISSGTQQKIHSIIQTFQKETLEIINSLPIQHNLQPLWNELIYFLSDRIK